MKNDSNFVKSAIRYRKLIYFLVAIMVAFGIYSLMAINKDEFPTFQIKDGLVVPEVTGNAGAGNHVMLAIPHEQIGSFLSGCPEAVVEIYKIINSITC